MLVHSQLSRTVKSGTVSKRNRLRCSHCSSIVESNSFTSTIVSSSFNLRQYFTCFFFFFVFFCFFCCCCCFVVFFCDAIYHIICKIFCLQYIGQTQQKCNQRKNKHKFNIKHFHDSPTTVTKHFTLPGHTIQDFSFISIDSLSSNSIFSFKMYNLVYIWIF